MCTQAFSSGTVVLHTSPRLVSIHVFVSPTTESSLSRVRYTGLLCPQNGRTMYKYRVPAICVLARISMGQVPCYLHDNGAGGLDSPHLTRKTSRQMAAESDRSYEMIHAFTCKYSLNVLYFQAIPKCMQRNFTYILSDIKSINFVHWILSGSWR
jgi:hypothetical protein